MAFNAGTIVAEIKADTTKYQTGIDAAQQKTKSFDTSGGKLSGTMAKLGTAFLGFFAATKVAQVLKEAVSASNSLETSLLGLQAISGATGNNFEDVKARAQALSEDGLITMSEASQSLLNLLPRFNGDLEQASTVLERLKDSASVARQGQLSMGEAVVGAAGGLKNLNSVMVDNAGVTKNISIILKEAGFQMEDLDNATKKQAATAALYNGLLKETEVFQGLAAESTETFAGKQAQLKAATFTLKSALGDALKPALSVIVQELTNSTNSAAANTGAFDSLAKALYVTTNFGIAIGSTLKTVAISLANAGARAIAFGSVVVTAMRDAAVGVFSFKQNFESLAEALKAAATGDFSRAADLVKTRFVDAFKTTSGSAEMFGLVSDELNSDLATQFGNTAQAVTVAFDSMNMDISSLGGATANVVPPVAGAAEAIKEEGKAAKEAAEDTSDLANVVEDIGDSMKDLKTKFEDTLSDFRTRIDAAKDSWKDFKKSVKDMRLEIKEVRKEFREAKSDLKLQLASDIADELIEAEGRIATFGEEIVEINADAAQKIGELQDEMAAGAFTEFEMQAHLDKITDMYADAADEISDINESLSEDIAGINEEMAEKIAAIQASINDYATEAETAEAAEKIAGLQAAGAEKIAGLQADAQEEIDIVNATTTEEIADLEAAKVEKERIFNEGLQAKIDAATLARDTELALIQEQINAENAFLEAHKQDYITFGDAITEARRVDGLDAVQVLKEQFAAEKQELINNKNEQIVDIKDTFAQQNELREQNFTNIKAMMKRERKAHNNHLEKMRERRKKFLDNIKSDFEELVNLLDTTTGGMVSAKTGGDTSSDISKKEGGGGSAIISIGNVTLNNQQDIDSFANSIALIFRAST